MVNGWVKNYKIELIHSFEWRQTNWKRISLKKIWSDVHLMESGNDIEDGEKDVKERKEK